MGAPSDPVTVEPSSTTRSGAASSCRSRSGPVNGGLEGVFQPAITGKYAFGNSRFAPEASSNFSTPPNTRHNNEATLTSLRIYYQNVRGLRTKIVDFFLAVCDREYDVIVLTETWLDDAIYSTQLFGNHYCVYRTDRGALNSTKRRGGGVLIAVASNITSHRDPAEVSCYLEQLWVRIVMQRCTISIGVLYLPPDRRNNLTDIQCHVDSIGAVMANLRSNDFTLQFGDYNQSAILWDTSNPGLPLVNQDRSRFTVASSGLLDGFNFNGLTQINSVANLRGRLLDLVLVNDAALNNCVVTSATEPLITVDENHPPLEIVFNQMTPIAFEATFDAACYDFRRADFDALSAAILATDWSSLDGFDSVDDAVDFFSSTVNRFVSLYVPLARPASKPLWGNNRLRRLKRHRSAALRRYCSSRSMYHKQQLNVASSEYRNYNKLLYARYVSRTQRNLRCNPKQFWSFVRSKRNEDGLPSSMFLGLQSASSNTEMCELFAAQFRKSFNSAAATPPQVTDAVRNTPCDAFDFNTLRINSNDVMTAIRKLKCSFNAGPDGIPAILLKRCGDVLVEPLAKIYCLSFECKQFPSSWKSSYLFPIHKKGDKRDISNYRGITSLSACAKVFEIIVNDSLFACCRQYISSDQHGFYPKRSVVTNIVQFTSTCIQALDIGKQVDAVYLDLKAAFDRVDHHILLGKLYRLGMSSNCIDWFRSYLIGRNLCVKIGSSESVPFTNVSGVPQGSNLGPLLFSLFLNDVSLILPPGVRLFYADDAKIYSVVSNLEDCFQLQELICRFDRWCAVNNLSLSIDKCQIISFTRSRKPIVFPYSLSGIPLERVQRVRDLGVILDDKLTFRLHIDDAISKANRQLGFMMKVAADFRDPLCLKSLYCALVRSILEFAVIAWCPYQSSWSSRIESVQKKFVRFALRNLPWRTDQQLTPYRDRCQLLGLDTLETRRKVHQAMFVAKILGGYVDSAALLSGLRIYAPVRPLRRRDFLHLGSRNSRFGQHDPLRYMSDTFNEVSHVFDFNFPVSSLKQKFTVYFRSYSMLVS